MRPIARAPIAHGDTLCLLIRQGTETEIDSYNEHSNAIQPTAHYTRRQCSVMKMMAFNGDQSPLIYRSINQRVLDSVPSHVRNVLDIGCGGGDLGEALKKNIKCKVTGLTFSKNEANLALNRLDRVEIIDLNSLQANALGQYDCIICSHVLEHLYDPEWVLCSLHEHALIPDGILVVALPNVLHWKQRLQFFLGRFRYTIGGIMDSTHYRFYDWDTACQLVSNAGYEILSRQADGIFPLSRLLGPWKHVVDRKAVMCAPGLLGTQFIIIAKKTA